MYGPPVLTFLVIVVTCVTSYQGFKSFAFERKYIFNPEAILAGKEYHRLVTSAFLHADWNHLIFNMMSLYFFGRGLEMYLGKLQFLAIYFGSIIGGDLLSLYVHRNHHYTSYGASGGVCGVIFASILVSPGIGISMFFLPIAIPGWLYAIGYILYSFFGMREHRGNIGHDAHLGGAIIGFLIAAGLQPSAIRDNLLVFASVLILSLLILVYLWMNPLFLPLSAFLGGSFQRREESASLPRYKVEARQVDAILEKIGRSGIDSLTAQEKQILEQASNKVRSRAESKKPESGLAI